VGVKNALEIIAFGNPVTARAAHEMGLVDVIAEGDLLQSAIAQANKVVGRPPRRTREQVAEKVDDAVYDEFARSNSRKFDRLDAPPAIIASVRAATELPFEQGVAREREIFLKLREGPQNEALRHVFFAEREAAKVPGIDSVVPREISRVGVVGSGTMGSGIAIALHVAGYPVTLYERDPAALDRGCQHIRAVLEANANAGRMTREAADAALNALQPVTAMEALSDVDLVIEAAYETMEVKRAIFSELDRIARPGAILASNTSYLDLDAIAQVTSRPSDVIGLHFFSPAHVMKLLEIVRGVETATDVIATAFVLAKCIGKRAVLSGNAWGFIGNRMLAVRREQAEAMAVEGASPAQVDKVMEAFGMAMGPFRVGDLAGLDLGWTPETSSGSTIRERLNEAGRRGQKTGKGFYDYDEKRRPVSSQETLDIIAGFARDRGIVQRAFTDEEILDRLLWPMVNEGASILADGIALRESDIDVVWINGYGWPAWNGGPMFHARRTGHGEVIRRLEELGIQPSAGLRKLAEENAP
jgi:3-hydroxyacyl-CoA dehydrogenase